MDQIQEQQQFQCSKHFFLHSDEPNSLVMLSNGKSVLRKILKQEIKPTFIWIYRSVHQVSNAIKNICQDTDASYYLFSSLSHAQSFLRANMNIREFCVITEFEFIKKAIVFYIFSGCLQIIQYNFVNSVDSSSQDIFEQSDDYQYSSQCALNQSSTILKLQSQGGLKIYISLKIQGQKAYRQLPNFESNRDMSSSNSILCCINSMIKQQVDRETRNKILDELFLLKTEINKENNDKQLFAMLKQDSLAPQQIVRIYSSNKSQFYKLINNFLRACKCPTQLFYIQPFFRQLFSSIKTLSQSNNQQLAFRCYRGGLCTEEEQISLYNNLGVSVQNLTFLSTSLNQQTANMFMKNAFFTIHVEVESHNFGNGFANISNYSEYYSEKQILFNPLNRFKLMEISVKWETHSLDSLVQPQIYVILNLQGIKRNLVQRQILFDQQQEQLKKNVKCQGDALRRIHKRGYKFYSMSYWQKYCQICLLGISKTNKCQKNNVLDKVQKCIKINYYQDQTSSQNVQQSSHYKFLLLKYMKGLCKKAEIFLRLGEIRKAVELYQKQQIFTYLISAVNIEIEEHHYQLLMMGVGFVTLQKYQHAIKILEKCESLLQNLDHENYYCFLRLQLFKNLWLATIFHSQENLDNLNSIADSIAQNHQYFYLYCIANQMIIELSLKYQRQKEAFHILKKIVPLYQETFGKRHQKYLNILTQLAIYFHRMGNIEQSIKLYRYNLRISDENLGQKYENQFFVLNRLANSLFLSGNNQQSLKIYKKCAKLSYKSQGKGHINYLIQVMNIGYIYYKIYFLSKKALFLLSYCKNQISYYNGPKQHFFDIIENLITQICQNRKKRKLGNNFYLFFKTIPIF